jgi:hypothetical protein
MKIAQKEFGFQLRLAIAFATRSWSAYTVEGANQGTRRILSRQHRGITRVEEPAPSSSHALGGAPSTSSYPLATVPLMDRFWFAHVPRVKQKLSPAHLAPPLRGLLGTGLFTGRTLVTPGRRGCGKRCASATLADLRNTGSKIFLVERTRGLTDSIAHALFKPAKPVACHLFEDGAASRTA